MPRAVADVWPALGLGDEPAGLLYAVNREYAERERELRDGDEVALIPPVSGGAFRVTEEPLSLEAAAAEVADERAGAVATFTGTVRRQSRGREVTRLEYEAYAEMAEDVMAQLAARPAGALRALRGRDPPPRRHARDRRGERRDRRVGPAPAGRARGLQGRNRHAQRDGAALEERGLRGRRGVDRPRLVTS